MEHDITTRYVFVMMLAIADPVGCVIGTDIALARRLNMEIHDFQSAVSVLSSPDSDSNSKEEDGRRLVPSDGERGYRIVNYLKYRNMKDEADRRAYMRTYMESYRNAGKEKPATVNSGKQCKHGKRVLTQAEASAEASANSNESTTGAAGKRLHGIPGTVEEVIAVGATLHPPKDESTCRAFWAHYEGQARTNENGEIFWVTSGDAVVTNWKVKLSAFGNLKPQIKTGARTNGHPESNQIAEMIGLKKL
jgi:hypothetical protein